MHKLASLITHGLAGMPATWHAQAPARRPSLSQMLGNIRRRHIAAHAGLLDLIIPPRRHA